MNFGDAWKGFMGEMDKKTVFEILDFFYDQGGNFIDTSNNYQYEQSEIWIGEWMQERKNRDQMVIATKFSSTFTAHKGAGIHVNSSGNSSKSLHVSIAASLKKLQTDYIDLLYVHWWDWSTSIPELMQSLNNLVVAGKVLYIGASDMPAWVVSKCNQYARDHGFAQFCVYQGEWSILKRDFEREILPMCKAEGLGICPWGALGGGKFKTEEQRQEIKEKGESVRNVDMRGGIDEKCKALNLVLAKLAKEKGTTLTGIALSYVMQKVPYVFPICGGRKVSHLQDNIEALSKIRLTEADFKELEAASPIDLGFPYDVIGGTTPHKNWLLNLAAKYNWPEEVPPILPPLPAPTPAPSTSPATTPAATTPTTTADTATTPAVK
jgi:aryl-alcohol dehydrogenase-like predicted oxidoreductase